ncbi:MAG: lipopolysaccharide transport periplasmic protein LptA [Pseudomonadota bacterium]|nr:lipopolysaccharide transport periplasmic protein LptA [Pseudomonadota bacterium]
MSIAAPVARAEKTDRDKPINYSADSGDVNIQTKVGTLQGNVVLTQGTLTIHADKVVFRQNPDNSLSATAYGNPVNFRQKRDAVDEYYEGFAQRGDYDGTKSLLQLYDRALLRRGGDEIRSNYISYDTTTELFKAEGRASSTPSADADGPGLRVRGVFQPKSASAPGKDASKGAPTKGSIAPVPLKAATDIAPSRGK